MKKLLLGTLIALTVLVMSVGTVFAQEGETTTISGTVQSVTTETDATTGETTVLVTLVDALGETQTVRISLATADSLGLLVEDDGDPLTPRTAKDTADLPSDPIDINSGDVIADDGGEEEAQHPVALALSYFFGEVLQVEGVDYDTIMALHEDGVVLEDGTTTGGFGFGVIAQALWITDQIEGTSEDFTALLDAKKSGDYTGILLADGSTPDNWGDVVTSMRKGDNLGKVKSGRAEKEANSEDQTSPETDQATDTQVTNANGNGNGNGNNSQNNGNGNNANSNSKKDKGRGGGRGHNK